MTKAFRALGASVHEEEQASIDGAFVGLELSKNRVPIKARRVWKLRGCLEHIRAKDSSSRAIIGTGVGHVAWAMLVRRESLALLHDAYRFVHDTQYKQFVLMRLPSRVAA